MTALHHDVAAHRAAPASGGLGRAAKALTALELRSFFRDRRSLVFVLFFPVMLLLIFGTIFNDTIDAGGIQLSQRQLFMAGIIAAGIMSTTFQGLAINVVQERESGYIRRLANSPMPKPAYFLAKIMRVIVTTIVEVVLLIALSVILFKLPLPNTGEKWWTLAWVVTLGTFACALMGMAFSAIIPNANSAAAIVTPVFMGLQFISGVFFPLNVIPSWMVTVASVFPLKWIGQGLRATFLPDAFASIEPAHSFELGRVALVLTAWIVVGALLTARTFKWRGPRVK